MRTMSLSEAKDHLSGLVDDAQATHEMVTITKHGRPAAVLMAADDLESLHETLHWLSQPDLRQDLDTAALDETAEDLIDSRQLRENLQLPSS